MKTGRENNDDLEYLSLLGHQMMAPGEQDLRALKKNIRSAARAKQSAWLAPVSLLAGMLLGALLFYLYTGNSLASAPAAAVKEGKMLTEAPPLLMDTVYISTEKYVKPVSKVLSAAANSVAEPDCSLITPVYPDLSLMLIDKADEKKLRYMINAPVFYIHDLKVTEYTTLYFRNKKFMPSSGTPASRTSNEPIPQSRLRSSAPAYLHEELAQALLQFKKQDYRNCIYLFSEIAQYNTVDINCSFYSGMSYYYLGDYNRAIEFLNICISSANNCFLEEAQFYKAMSLQASGDVPEARELFSEIAEMEGFYSEKARAQLK